jgi:hypothetical protein
MVGYFPETRIIGFEEKRSGFKQIKQEVHAHEIQIGSDF